MSMFGDYKAYRKYLPDYTEWKTSRDLAEAKREEYLRKNPDKINNEDIQRSKAILRAIDVMDEYSQKRAEDMEVATETVVSTGLELATYLGMGIAALLVFATPLKKVLLKKLEAHKDKASIIMGVGSALAGSLVATIAAIPLFAWAAKTEVKASRKGRFEAMRKDLKDPRIFAILNKEQEEQLKTNLEGLTVDKKSLKNSRKFKDHLNTFKEMVKDSPEYINQKADFETQLAKDEIYWDKELTPSEIEKAKKNQQLLTKLVEKIDIASQDYAENAELATTAITSTLFGLGSLFALGYEKIATKLSLKSTSAPAILGFSLMIFASIFSAGIQKQAARVGRFKIKQELLKHPEQLVYVLDEKTGEISDIEVKPQEKLKMFKFIKNMYKNNKEFNKWKKTEGLKEKNHIKAMEGIELTEEQLKDAKALQHSTFKTFNKVDESSQKYSESVEALGQSIQYPLTSILAAVGVLLGGKHLTSMMSANSSKNMLPALSKYISIVFLTLLPSIGINAYLTKEQKKASRVADMLAINELQDYRHFADFSKYSK